ncbi:MAG: adenylate/guanylate cyclase domain-containing protein [Chloroflexi bacterium]|nr:MAG: adenylate/guanylate cyclase domain-containing protein [Chloroflexota bacterium]
MPDSNLNIDAEVGNLNDEIQRLQTLADDIASLLRSQSKILERRNLRLPTAPVDNLQQISVELNDLKKYIADEDIELGQLRLLAETSAMINSTLDADMVLNRAMSAIIRLSGAERGYIILRNPETGELEFRISHEIDDVSHANGSDQKISHTILDEVVTTGQPLLKDNAYKDPTLSAEESIHRMVLRSVLCVPLTIKEEVIGAIYVDNRMRAGVFTERELNLLMAFANQTAVAIDNARLFADLQNNINAAEEIRQLLDNVFESIDSGVITLDKQEVIQTFNRAAGQILAIPVEEVFERALTLREVMPGITFDLQQLIYATMQENLTEMIEVELDISQRGHVVLNTRLSPLKDAELHTQGVTMVFDDLTEIRERERALDIMGRYLSPEMVENIHEIAGLALGGERREVTCIFVDVRPLKTFPDDMPPQEIMEALNQYHVVATDCVHGMGGIIDKYLGNEIMALFNTQLNPLEEDHALRTVEAALQMRDGFVELYQSLGIDPNPHFYRIGINSGVATLGNVGSLNRREFTAIGDTINLSKRLEENATGGQIIVSEDTLGYIYEANGGTPIEHIRFEPLEAIQVKGRQQKTMIYEVFRA